MKSRPLARWVRFYRALGCNANDALRLARASMAMRNR